MCRRSASRATDPVSGRRLAAHAGVLARRRAEATSVGHRGTTAESLHGVPTGGSSGGGGGDTGRQASTADSIRM